MAFRLTLFFLTLIPRLLAQIPADRALALEKVATAAIQRARKDGLAVFDFGISNEAQGRVLNEALYRFKTSFAGASAVHAFFEADLAAIIGSLQPSAEAA